MHTTDSSFLKKNGLAAAVSVALGVAGTATPMTAAADVYEFSWTGLFTMMDANGAAIANTSIPAKGNNQFQTPVTGTLTYDTTNGSGSATIAPFDFFSGSEPAAAQAISFDEIGDGAGGPGSLLLTNMLFNWNGVNGIPVSLVWDAQGLQDTFAANRYDDTPLSISDTVSGVGVEPAYRGTYTDAVWGYLGDPTAPTPMASTDWDTSFATGCSPGDCTSVNPSGILPLITDTATNLNRFDLNTPTLSDLLNGGVGIGGNPMADGPFSGSNANFDMDVLTLTSFTDTTAPESFSLNGSNPTNVQLGGTYTEDGAACTDAIDGVLDGSVVIGGDTVDENAEGTYVVTYDCSDTSGNAATQLTRTVNVVGVAPIITLTGINPETFEAGTGTYTDAGATCDDQFDNSFGPGDGDIPLPTSGPGSLFFDVTLDTVNENVPGSYGVTYSCTDSESNPAADVTRTVNVVDTVAPVITLTPDCVGGITIEAGDPDPTPTATAIDPNRGTDLTADIVATGTVDTNPTYPDLPSFGDARFTTSTGLGWSVDDDQGNTGTASCIVEVLRKEPLVTLNGAANITINEGDTYTEEGAVCEDAIDGDISSNLVITGTVDTTTAGSYPINYDCTDNDGNDAAQVVRTVTVAGGSDHIAAPVESGSVFVMLDRNGGFMGGAEDVFAQWDGSLLTDANDPTINMVMGSATPTPFRGFTWTAHDVRVFGPGTYTFDTCNPGIVPPDCADLTMTVNEGQVGAHMLFDWNVTTDIDVVLVWDINAVFAGPLDGSDGLGSKGQVYNMSSSDPDGDGVSGMQMVDGPFSGSNANFNLNFTPPYSAGSEVAPLLGATQSSLNTNNVVWGSGTVEVAITGPSGSTFSGFDWSGSDAALLSAEVACTNADDFCFNPDNVAAGTYNASLLTNEGSNSITLNVLESGNLADLADSDGNGVPDGQTNPDVAAGDLQLAPTGTDAIQTSSGTLVLGDAAIGAGGAGAEVSGSITIDDEGAEESCIGGCFDFQVIGLDLNNAETVDVILPLNAPIPAGAEYRKEADGVWAPFSTSADTIASAPRDNTGACPATGYTEGLNENDECVMLSISDGGANDADRVHNGVIKDPGGVALAAAPTVIVSNVGNPEGSGCSIASGERSPASRGDWWLLAAALAWLGLRRRKQQA